MDDGMPIFRAESLCNRHQDLDIKLCIDNDNSSSSSGSSVDESPTLTGVKPDLKGAYLKPYSQAGSNNSGGKFLTLSGPKGMNITPQKAQLSVSHQSSISGQNLNKVFNKINTNPLPSLQIPREQMSKSTPGLDAREESKEEFKTEPEALLPDRVNYIRKRDWKSAKKYQMEATVQMHSDFYENQREEFHALRQTSNVLFLRKFNNWVKSVLINQTCYTKGRYLSVLDICCGKGGDLQKWIKNRVFHYVGVDLSDNSVRNASERFKKMKNRGGKLPFHGIFVVNNVGDQKNSFLNYLDKKILFDVASCQMSMHYLCESETTARTFLSNVSSRLVPGGLFCGTTLDADVLVRRLRTVGLSKDNKDKYTFGNQFYSAKFMHRDFPQKKAFGIKYLFYLEDGVGHKRADGTIEYVPEYLVIFKKFVELAKEYDLKLIKRENFHKFYEQNIEIQRNKDLFDRIVKPHEFASSIKQEQLDAQWEICHLYQTFTFKKMSSGIVKGRIQGTQGRCGRDREDRFMFIDTNK
ncbi:unnamed protein product [Moneuplotes crassus]|uniref:mRNA (guanine-N(7))-methyltransferase n=2 Tax=Euplotes crassus TaxID=5936 RepID=A0AAD1U6N9_EUPCR|nr:unnamed protein product [Moneuplotes crassus]